MDKKQDLIDGHRLIRNFQREKEIELVITEFKFKEIGLVNKRLLEIMEYLKEEMENNKDNVHKQLDIAGDMGVLKHYISSCAVIDTEINNISNKYGLDSLKAKDQIKIM